MAEYIGRMQAGNLCLVLCCIFYLIWWSIAFNPNRDFPMAAKSILFLVTLCFGLAGVGVLVWGMAELPKEKGGISSGAICVIGIVAYALLLFLTYHFLQRQVTTELALIVGWTALEVCVMNALWRADALGAAAAVVMAVVVVVAAVIGMLCYLAYYELDPQIAFYDGMVPLILFAVVMAIEILVVARCAAV